MSILKDKIALVTGGSRGIGRAIAEVFAKVGATVVISGRKQYALDQVVQDNTMLTGRIVPLQCNVTRLEELEGLAETVQREFGPVDILVNNAATNLSTAMRSIWGKRSLTAQWRRTSRVSTG